MVLKGFYHVFINNKLVCMILYYILIPKIMNTFYTHLFCLEKPLKKLVLALSRSAFQLIRFGVTLSCDVIGANPLKFVQKDDYY